MEFPFTGINHFSSRYYEAAIITSRGNQQSTKQSKIE